MFQREFLSVKRGFIYRGAVLTLPLLLLLVLVFSCQISNPYKGKSYVVGIDPTWYPLDLMGKDKNLEAFIKELVKGVAKEKGIDLKFTLRSWDNLLEDLEKGAYDAIVTTLMPREFYGSRLFFSSSLFTTAPVLVVRKNFQVTHMMSDKLIAVNAGFQESLVTQHFPGAVIKFYQKIPPVLDEIILENIDGATVNTVLAHAYIYDFFSTQLKIGSKPLGTEGIRLVSRKGESRRIIDVIEKGVDKAKKEGVYKKLLKKWTLMPGLDE